MSSSNRMIVGTRKGLLVLERKSAGWKVVRYAHSASPVPYAVVDPRHGTLWASLDHGHWGCKLHRSPDLGATWEEVEAPKYPKSARTKPWTTGKPQPATLRYIWVIQPGGADQQARTAQGGKHAQWILHGGSFPKHRSRRHIAQPMRVLRIARNRRAMVSR